MATVNIGNIKFNWKGAWSNSTTYAVDDVVSLSGSSYISIQAGSNQNPASASAYWQQMSSAGTNGTNGTDLTSTLTTQGDIVYRDGSGLQRLAKGTASQELRMNSGATAPEWHTPAVASSDFVKLATITASSTAEVQFDGHFTSDYDMYKIMMYDVYNSTNSHIAVRFMRGGSNVTANSYKTVIQRTYTDGTPSNSTSVTRSSWNSNSMVITDGDYVTQSATSARLQGEIILYNPLSTGARKVIQSSLSFQRHGDSNTMHHNTAYGRDESATTALSGINVTNNSGNFTGGTFKLYGIK
jgi:hypothetical protein